VRLSLRWRLVGGFGLLLFLIALLGWVTLATFGSLRRVQSGVFDEAIPGLVAVDEIVRSYTAQSAAVRGYLINSQVSLLEQYEQEVGTARVWEREAMRHFRNPEERGLLTDLIDAGRSFQHLVDSRVVPLAKQGQRALAFNVLGQRGGPSIAQVETLGARLRSAQDDVVAAREAEIRSRSNQVVAILLVVLVGALATGVVLAIVLPRQINADLSSLVHAARAIGAGDFDQEVDIRSGDELAELATHFEEMQAGLKRLQQLAVQDRELEIAASIQRNLLQRTLPEAPGFRLVPLQRQANLVGGDCYDVDYEAGQLTVVVGDSSGKGIGAALMATVVLSVLRAERARGAGPRRVVGRANEALREAADPGSFTTLLYASIDVESGHVRWLNMGHPSPFLLRQEVEDDGGKRGYYLEGPRNRALGWFEDPGLAETVLRLNPGDRLIFFTDGFLEAKSPEGEVFGEHRFGRAIVRLAPLGSEAVGEALVEEVERFAAGKLDDDLTMLIVEFQGAPVREGVVERLTGEEPWHSRR
jgi:serine phosphatase RsbU (regulator of sigma subunit)